jgi:hypothetical protein
MACERYEDALTETAAGAPPAAELESHLAGCARCREQLEELRRTLALVDSDMRQLVAAEPSPELAVRIRRAAAEAEPQTTSRPVWLWPALAASALLIALVFVVTGRGPARPSAVAVASPSPAIVHQPPTPPEEAPPSTALAPPGLSVPRHAAATSQHAAPPEPEVLVPPGEAEALLRLVALVNRDGVAPPVLGATGQASPDLAELRVIDIGSIDIQPLEIVPLDPAETSGT